MSEPEPRVTHCPWCEKGIMMRHQAPRPGTPFTRAEDRCAGCGYTELPFEDRHHKDKVKKQKKPKKPEEGQ